MGPGDLELRAVVAVQDDAIFRTRGGLDDVAGLEGLAELVS